jgi:hypothetical protein
MQAEALAWGEAGGAGAGGGLSILLPARGDGLGLFELDCAVRRARQWSLPAPAGRAGPVGLDRRRLQRRAGKKWMPPQARRTVNPQMAFFLWFVSLYVGPGGPRSTEDRTSHVLKTITTCFATLFEWVLISWQARSGEQYMCA